MKLAWVLAFAVLSGCATLESITPRTAASAPAAVRTYEAPIGRVKPAYVSTLATMGMSISSIDTQGAREVLKARKAGSSVEIEFERRGPASTRVRVAMNSGAAYDAAATTRLIQQSEKLLSAS